MSFRGLASSACLLMVALALSACSSSKSGGNTEDAGPGGACTPTGGQSRFYVLNYLDVGRSDPAGDPSIVPGFNLDAHNTTAETDPVGCGWVDFSSGAPDNITGVDNQLGPFLGGLSGVIDIPEEIAKAIREGKAIVLAEVTGIDNFTNDDCVGLSLYIGQLQAGVTMPMLDSMMRLSAGQTFDLDARSFMADRTTPQVHTSGRIVAGRLQAGPTEFSLAFSISGNNILINVHQTQIRFNLTESGGITTGVLGGQVNVNEVVSTIATVQPDFESQARSLLNMNADLEPDSTGACRSISLGLIFSGVTAVKGNVVTNP